MGSGRRARRLMLTPCSRMRQLSVHQQAQRQQDLLKWSSGENYTVVSQNTPSLTLSYRCKAINQLCRKSVL